MPTYGLQLCGSPIEAKRNPTSPVDAQFSGPFAAALALTEKRAGIDLFTSILDNGMSDEFRRLMQATDVKQADDLDAIHPEFWPGRVTLEIGGDTVDLYGKHMHGEKQRPMPISDVQAKFEELSPNHDDSVRRKVYAVIDDLENSSVDDLVAPLRS